MKVLIPILLASLAGALRPQQRTVPYEKFATAFATRNGIEGPPDGGKFEQALNKHWVRLSVAGVTVWYPVESLGRRSSVARFGQALTAILEAQLTLSDWMTGERGKPLSSAGRSLRKWIQSWQKRSIGKKIGGSAGDLLDLLRAPDVARRATKELRELFESGKAFGLTVKAPRPQRIVLCPDRRTFLETACFLGAVSAANKTGLWQNNIVDRAQSFVGDPFPIELVALEYASPTQSGQDFTSSLDMNTREKNGLQQHVTQVTTSTLVGTWFGQGLPRRLEAGLVTNVVIAVCGEDNTRSGGDERGGHAAAKSAFVPGGKSEGGQFMAANLDSPWRSTKGRDWFEKILGHRMKSAAKKTRDKTRRLGAFVIHSDDQSDSRLVYAPFLGAAANTPGPVPATFAGDHNEFLRAYACGFVHWLRVRAGKRSVVQARFAQFLRGLQASPKDLDKISQEIYGVPFSAPRGDDGLEWRFLKSL